MEPIELLLTMPDGASKVFRSEGVTSIGRRSENDITIDLPFVSAIHSIIQPQPDGWHLRDMGSRNGTSVNGALVKECTLRDGYQVGIGPVQLSVRIPAPDTQTTGIRLVHRVFGEEVQSSILSMERRGFRPESMVADEQELRQDYEKLRIAHDLSLNLGPESDPDQILQKVLDFCMAVLPVDHAVALLRDESSDEMTIRTCRHRQAGTGEVHISRTVVDRVARTGEALLLKDASAQVSKDISSSVHDGHIRSVLAIPISSQKQVKGVIFLDNRSLTSAFQEKDLHLVSGIAAQASLALERVALVQKIEAEATTQAFLCRFLSPALVEDVKSGRIELGTSGQRCQLAVLFADLRGFTSFAERAGPTRTVEMLNEHFEKLEAVVFNHGGILDKFVGDALMATWGYPLKHDDYTVMAVKCALEMQNQLAELAVTRVSRGLEAVGMGIAIHVGEAVVGCIGSNRRMDFTAIGDTVNLAARMSGLAKPGEVLVSHELVSLLGDTFHTEKLPKTNVKGRKTPVQLYRVLPLPINDGDDS